MGMGNSTPTYGRREGKSLTIQWGLHDLGILIGRTMFSTEIFSFLNTSSSATS
jgi:hypothetical protein